VTVTGIRSNTMQIESRSKNRESTAGNPHGSGWIPKKQFCSCYSHIESILGDGRLPTRSVPSIRKG